MIEYNLYCPSILFTKCSHNTPQKFLTKPYLISKTRLTLKPIPGGYTLPLYLYRKSPTQSRSRTPSSTRTQSTISTPFTIYQTCSRTTPSRTRSSVSCSVTCAAAMPHGPTATWANQADATTAEPAHMHVSIITMHTARIPHIYACCTQARIHICTLQYTTVL